MVKIFEEMYNSLDTIYRRVTDGRTDILRRHRPRYAYASRGKNCRSSNLKKFDVTPTDRQTDRQTVTNTTISSAVAERPRDASCH